MRKTLFLTIILSGFGVVAGCGEAGPETVPVTGTVTYNGEPVQGANVTFMPNDGRPASGTTDAQGQFELMTFDPGDGALPGEHHVLISKIEAESEASAENPYPEESSLLPERYSQPAKSDLKVMVKPGEENQFQFDLTS